MKKKEWIFLFLILFSAFAVRTLISLKGLKNPDKYFKYSDSYSYINPAFALLKTGKFNESKDSTIPYSVRTPGYPLFLAVVFAISENNAVIHIIIFILISSLTCIPVYLTGRLFLNSSAGLIAAALFALNLTSIANAPLYLTDTLFTFLIAWKLYFFTKLYFEKKIVYSIALAVLYGLATQVRPMGLFWIIPCIFLIVIIPKFSFKKKIVCIMIILAAYSIFILSWMYRNYKIDTGFYLDANMAHGLYIFNTASFVSILTGEPADKIRERWIEESEKLFYENPEYSTTKAKLEYYNAEAKKIILQHPIKYFILMLRPYILLPDIPTFFEILGLTQTGRNTQDVLNRLGFFAAVKNYFNGRIYLIIYIIPLILITLITYISAFVQLIKWCVNKKIFLFFYFLAFAVYYMAVPGVTTPPRYNLPMIPILAVMAAILISNLFNSNYLSSYLRCIKKTNR